MSAPNQTSGRHRLLAIADPRPELFVDVDTDVVGTAVFISDGYGAVRVYPERLGQLLAALTEAQALTAPSLPGAGEQSGAANRDVPAGPRSVLHDWVMTLPMMQQTVLLTAVRGPDGLPKYHPTKWVLRWYRRCVLLSALDQRVLGDSGDPSGGSFTGPSTNPDGPLSEITQLDRRVDDYLQTLDEVPHHFQLHLLHGVEILGYKHPDLAIRIWWRRMYERLVHDMHLWPETEEQLDQRLGDTRDGWLARADKATVQ